MATETNIALIAANRTQIAGKRRQPGAMMASRTCVRLAGARVLFALLIASSARAADPVAVTSPNGRLHLEFSLADGGIPQYQITRDGRRLVELSRLGLEPDWLADFTLVDTKRQDHAGEWHNPLGERSTVPDNYREARCTLRHAEGVELAVEFRAYNEGVALRYATAANAATELTLTGERTEFRFPAGTSGYEEHGTEGEYRRAPIADFQPYCERPITLELPGGAYAALAEAANHAYPRTLFSPAKGAPGGLVTALGGATSNGGRPTERHDPAATLAPGAATPWRVLIVGDRPGDLLERNYLLLNLNPAAAAGDVAWIKPGKVMRDTQLTTANAKAIIDFAPTAGLSYVHLDAGWYGPERGRDSDASAVERRRAGELDLAEIIRYGRERGVGVILYVNDIALRRQRDEIFPLYRQWGVAGVKVGFIRVGPQAETEWATETIRSAAQHRLLVNIHDGYRATGNARTFPNLMTVEGIRGNEHMPTAEHNCTLPFTRYVGGAGDYTVCYYNNRIQTTHAHQLAMHVVSFSPLQWILWYDRPDMYRGEPEIEFFRVTPTVWDETRVIHGTIGEYATIARRSGDAWFVGTINGSTPRRLSIPLEFLPTGQSYSASVYDDDANSSTRTHVAVRREEVDASDTIVAELAAGGGQAIWIAPPSAAAEND